MKKLFSKKIIIFLLIGLLLGGGIVGYRYYASTKKQSSGKSTKANEHTVKQETLKQTLTISGKIEAEEKATVRFQSSGKIVWIGVKKGDTVKKYQALASQDKEELQKNLEKYLNTYLDSRWDFDQTKDEYRQPDQHYWGLSWDQRNAVDRALQQAQFDLNNSVLDVEIKNIALKSAVIYSPIDGIVTNIGSPYTGIYVTPTQAEFEIINPDTIYFSLLPDQNEVTELTASMAASIVMDAYPEEPVTGHVKDISFTPKSGETSTVYEVKIPFDPSTTSVTKYRLGMTGDATFTTLEKQGVLAVPPSFIKTEKENSYVIKKVGSKKEKVFVETGTETDDFVEITSGLAEGDVIYD